MNYRGTTTLDMFHYHFYDSPLNLMENEANCRGHASSKSSYLTRLIRIRRGGKFLLAERRHSSPTIRIIINLVKNELSELAGPLVKPEISPKRLHGIEIDDGENAPILKFSSAFFFAIVSPILFDCEEKI